MVTSHETSLERLLEEVRGGNPDAMGPLLEHYSHYLSLLARLQIARRLQGKADPSDLVQETLLKAHRDFAGFKGSSEAELTCWLRQLLATSLAGLVRRYLGTQRRDVRLEEQLVDDLDRSSRMVGQALATTQSTPSEQAARREQAVLLAEALAQLPDHYREVIILHHLEGLTLAQTAARLGRTADSVEKLWMRALLRLKSVLRE
jgi:RNA polymerase sigma-70 factor (ECF subfamily)